MTVAAHNVLAAFNALAPKEQQQVAVEILRRSATTDELAGEVSRRYDAEESSRADA
jgi:hypothetical protein